MIDTITLYGAMAYSLTVGLLVVWIGIGLSFARRGSLRWYIFCGAMLCYLCLFLSLTFVSLAPPWLDRTANMLLSRSAAWLGVLQAIVFTVLFLRNCWRRERQVSV